WDAIKTEICGEFDRLEKANSELGNKYDQQVAAVKGQMEVALRSKDVRIGRSVLNDINSLYFAVTYIYQLIGFVNYHLRNFDQIIWKDENQARHLLIQGKEIAEENPSEEVLRAIVQSVVELMVEPPVSGPGVSF
ncbi:MAG: hypothetical protein K2M54_03135, partial [Muribaculaceae bacterium]|nr:hypothetical protein [Muribaculaceae bacterium]